MRATPIAAPHRDTRPLPASRDAPAGSGPPHQRNTDIVITDVHALCLITGAMLMLGLPLAGQAVWLVLAAFSVAVATLHNHAS